MVPDRALSFHWNTKAGTLLIRKMMTTVTRTYSEYKCITYPSFSLPDDKTVGSGFVDGFNLQYLWWFVDHEMRISITGTLEHGGDVLMTTAVVTVLEIISYCVGKGLWKHATN